MTALFLPRVEKELTGTVRHILWCNWGVDVDSTKPGAVIARLDDRKVVKGMCQAEGIEIGLTYRFLGRWQQHYRYGSQFHFTTFCQSEPVERSGVISYLVKLAPHVGEKRAARLWDTFGAEAVAMLRTAPNLVAETGILSHDQARKAAVALEAAAHLEQTKMELFGLFDRRGFPERLLSAVIDRWGAQAPQLIRRNPFILLTAHPRLPGCGFQRCDKLYRNLGLPSNRTKRQMLCAWHALRTEPNGHTWLPWRFAVEAIDKTTMGNINPPKAIQLGIRSKWLAKYHDAQGQSWLAEFSKAENERRLATKLAELLAARPEWSGLADGITAGIGSLSEHQLQQLARALKRSVGILAGTPGTGKTYTAAQIVKCLSCSFGLDSIAICAPTGKAAVRCTSALLSYGIDLSARTVHRLLGITHDRLAEEGWSFIHNHHNPLEFKFIIVDESSMLPVDLTTALLSACRPGTHVLFVGDPYQLPPVGHGAPLRDMIAAGIPCGELSEIRRNAGMIVQACAQIKIGKEFEVADQPDLANQLNLQHIETTNAQESIERLRACLAEFAQAGKYNPIWDVQVLVAVNGKSHLSRRVLNPFLQKELNPNGATVPDNPYRVGDKIICLRNAWMPSVQLTIGRKGRSDQDYQLTDEKEHVANGEIARVVALGPTSIIARFAEPDRLIRAFVGTRRCQDQSIDEDASEAGDIDLAYAVTTHKMQGSETPVAIVMIDDSPGAKWICSREHIYTSLSRAKDLCITIGQRALLKRMAKRVGLARRKTFLKELIQSSTAHWEDDDE